MCRKIMSGGLIAMMRFAHIDKQKIGLLCFRDRLQRPGNLLPNIATIADVRVGEVAVVIKVGQQGCGAGSRGLNQFMAPVPIVE